MKVSVAGQDLDQKVNAGMFVEVEQKEVVDSTGGGGGPSVLRIRVNDEKGLGAYFHVSVAINKQGRPVVEVATELRNGPVDCYKTIRKSVTGTCNKV